MEQTPPLTDAAYTCDPASLGPYAERFVRLWPDDDNRRWLSAHGERPHGLFRQALMGLLAPFMTLYDVHGVTGSYPMHLLSTGQLRELVSDGHARLLDVGAGAGHVTAHAEPLADRIACTETSKPLARRLRARGYEVHVGDAGVGGLLEGVAFDALLCLNVLDRTPYPRRLLTALRSACAQGTPALFSVPLPLRPAVLVAGGSVDPVENLPCTPEDFGASMRVLCAQLFEPAGFEVKRLARAPYLSAGDRHQSLYVLDAALFVLTPRS